MAVDTEKLKSKKSIPKSKLLERQKEKHGKNNRNILDPGEQWRCVCCGTKYTTQQSHFLYTSSKLYAFWNYCYPVCKECLNAYWDDVALPKFGYDEVAALKYMCAVLDWAWSERAYESTKKKLSVSPGGTMLPVYSSQRKLAGATKIDGYTFADTLEKYFESVSGNENGGSQTGNGCIEEDDELQGIDPEVITRFGHGYTKDEYEYLAAEYQDWTTRYDCQTKAQEELFKNICFAQLNTRRYQQAGDGRRASEAMEISQKLMDTAKVTPKQDRNDQLAATNTFGTLLKKWEDERPIPEPDPEWADVDGIRKYISTWFLGHLCKMFKIDNDVTQLYDEEVSAYTVDPPQFAEDDDESAADEFGDIFGSAVKNHRVELEESVEEQ